MPRFIWSRLFGRERDSDSTPIFDLFQEADPRHLGFGLQFFANRTRQTRDEPAMPAADPRTASPPTPPAFAIADPIGTASGLTAVVRPVTVATPAPEEVARPDIANLGGDPAERVGLVSFAPMLPLQPGGGASSPFGTRVLANYVIPFGPHFEGGVAYDTVSMTLLTGGAGDWPELFAGPDDTLELSGDFSSGFGLPGGLAGIDTIVLRGGNDYNLVANDNDVAAGETLTINAMPLRDANHAMFDGSAESDGRFEFWGSDAGDFFFGGAGDDRILGLGGADSLVGGGGSDIFVYTRAQDSTGTGYDTIADFDPAADRIDLPGAVTGFGAAIEGGALSFASFNDDLSAALGNLGAGQAVWFAPDSGDLAGQIFLIVDGNGQAGYQDGEDFVIAIDGAPLADLTGHTDIFI